MVVATVTFLKLSIWSKCDGFIQLRSQRWHIAPEAWERQVVPLGRLLVSMIDWLSCKQSSKLAETGCDTIVSVVVDNLEAAANKWRCGWLSSWAYFHQWGHFALRAVRRLSQATYQGMKDIQWTFPMSILLIVKRYTTLHNQTADKLQMYCTFFITGKGP